MEIHTRMVQKYMEVKVTHNDTEIDMGLLNEEERRDLARSLEEAVDEICSGLP